MWEDYYFEAMARSQLPPEPATTYSSHFIFHYITWSDVSGRLDLIASHMEQLRSAAIAWLDLTDIPAEPASVWVVDREDDPDRWGVPEPPSGWIRVTYQADDAWRDMDRAFVRYMLTSWVGRRSEPPAALVDGLIGLFAESPHGEEPSQANAHVAAQIHGGHRVSIRGLLAANPTTDGALAPGNMTSWLGFLLSAYGADRFKQFMRLLETDPPERGLERAYNTPLLLLERGWLTRVSQTALRPVRASDFAVHAFGLLRPYRGSATLAALAAASVPLWAVASPFLFARFIDHGIVSNDRAVIAAMLIALCVLFAARTVGELVASLVTERLGARLAGDLRRRMLDQLYHLSPEFYDRLSTRTLTPRLAASLEAVESVITDIAPRAAIAVLVGIVNPLVLFAIDWRLAIAGIVLLVALVAGRIGLGVRPTQPDAEHGGAASSIAEAIRLAVDTYRLAKAFNLGTSATRILRPANAPQRSSGQKDWRPLADWAFATAAPTAVLLALGAIGGLMAADGKLGLGSLLAALLLVWQAGSAHATLLDKRPQLRKAEEALRGITEFLDEQPAVAEAADAVALPRLADSVRLNRVTFSYTGSQVNLNNVSLSIPARGVTGVFGPRGSGKSTLLNLILRFYDPLVGTVSFDGQDIRQVTQESLRGQIGAVLQEVVLLNTTVRDNIRLGSGNVTDEQVEAAAKAAEIHDTIVALPHGYDTIVGAGGARLSEGERQRIAIARALVQEPTLLLLDEATSALDAETEAAILATLKRLAADQAVVITSHRANTVRDADTILVLDNGRLVESGTHDSLLALRGLYRWSWQQQQTLIDDDVLTPPVIAARLQAVPMFRGFDDSSLAELAQKFAPERYEGGEIIFEPRVPADKFYLIARGRVEIIGTGLGGEERVLAVHRDPEYFGEFGLQSEAVRTTTARTRTPTSLLSLERRQMRKSMAHVVLLPDVERRLVNWVLRHGDVAATEAAAQMNGDEETTRTLLQSLAAKGFIEEVESVGVVRYRARIATRRGPRVPQSVWDKIEGSSPR